MKKLLVILIVLCTLCCLSCTEIEEYLKWNQDFLIEGQEAISLAENFCFALSDDNINEAEKYLHPDSPLNGGELSLFLSKFEQTNDVDFSNGVAFRDRDIGDSYANTQNYEGYHQGNAHIFYLKVVIDRKIIKLSFEVVSNEKGFGIYSVEKYNPDK